MGACRIFLSKSGEHSILGSSCTFPTAAWTQASGEGISISQNYGALLADTFKDQDLTVVDPTDEKPYVDRCVSGIFTILYKRT